MILTGKCISDRIISDAEKSDGLAGVYVDYLVLLQTRQLQKTVRKQ